MDTSEQVLILLEYNRLLQDENKELLKVSEIQESAEAANRTAVTDI